MIKITVDNREKRSDVPAALQRKGFDVVFRQLPVGDYIAGGAVIERKAAADFVVSLKNQTLWEQLRKLKGCGSPRPGARGMAPLLILEGNPVELALGACGNAPANGARFGEALHPNSLRGALLAVALRWGVPMICSRDAEETAEFIALAARRSPFETWDGDSGTDKKLKAQSVVLESIPGIGRKTARALLGRYGSVREILLASPEELARIPGVGKARAAKIVQVVSDSR